MISGLHPGTPYSVIVVAFFDATGVVGDNSTEPYTGLNSTAITQSGTTSQSVYLIVVCYYLAYAKCVVLTGTISINCTIF